MSPSFSRFVPKGLAGRLVLLLIAALALAQTALVILLHGEQDRVVEEIAHGQALNQTVTLARLLTHYPASEGDTLAEAFGSRLSCARISAVAPSTEPMSTAEQQLARLLGLMLHGVGTSMPYVAIGPMDPSEHPCQSDTAGPTDRSVDFAPGRRGQSFRHGRGGLAAVEISVPLRDGRWLTTRMAVAVPTGWNRITVLSFLLSSLAVAAAAVIGVRSQTRSLGRLAAASERFGRGERVDPLPADGPSEVAAAIVAFNTMQDRLSGYMRDRLKLLAGISHDLRTPLTTLRLKAEFIDDEAVRDDIVATIDELSAICEATLAFSRAEATAEATAEVELNALAGDVVGAVKLAGADATLQPSPPLPYACRPVALKRALQNLVDNAVRYGGNARVSLARSDGRVLIRVDDDGPGLPADQMEEAFKPFVRLEASRSIETGGIGLGLAIARSIIVAHGGTIRLVNRPEGGLRAEIELP